MCGIYGYVGSSNQAAKISFKGINRLEYRGYDSWGVAINSGTKIKTQKGLGRISQGKLTLGPSHLAIAHTRWATHGGVTVTNAHPHLSLDKRWAVVHNGIIENYQELKDEWQLHNICVSETDTEVIAQLLAHKRSDSLTQTLIRVSQFLQGFNAFVALDVANQAMGAYSNGSPLIAGKSKSGYHLASDLLAFGKSVTHIAFIPDKHMVVASAAEIKCLGMNGKPVKLNWKPSPPSTRSTSKKAYAHFMLKEIHDQVKLIRDYQNLRPGLSALKTKLQRALVLNFIGCGTAYHAAMYGSRLFSRQAITQAFMGSEADVLTQAQSRQDLSVFLSQSGETIDLLEPAKALLSQKRDFVSLVNRPFSTLARLSPTMALLQAGPEIAVVSTKAFMAKLLTLIWLSQVCSLKEFRNNLKSLETQVIGLLSQDYRDKHLAAVIEQLKDLDHLYILGRGLSYPLALEMALKIKESSYLHAEAFAAGELKHGVLALISDKSWVILLAPDDDYLSLNLSTAIEIKARGGKVLGISDTNHPAFDRWLPLATLDQFVQAGQAVVGQLLAYHLAIRIGLNPDRPRNLAKSVTVK